MNEQAIQDVYNLAVQNGYKKSIDEFKILLSTNQNALNDVYGIAKNNGYQKSIDDFSVLMGVKKKDATAISAGSTSASTSPQVSSSVSSSSQSTQPSPELQKFAEGFMPQQQEQAQPIQPQPINKQSPQMEQFISEQLLPKEQQGTYYQKPAAVVQQQPQEQQPQTIKEFSQKYFTPEIPKEQYQKEWFPSYDITGEKTYFTENKADEIADPNQYPTANKFLRGLAYMNRTMQMNPTGGTPRVIYEFIDDMARDIASGSKDAAAVTPNFKAMLNYSNMSDEDVRNFIEANKNVAEAEPSQEMMQFMKSTDEDPSTFNLFKQMALNPTGAIGIGIRSMRAMINPASMAAAGTVVGTSAAGGALVGSAVPLAGTAAGAASAATASLPYAMGVASGTLDASLSFGQYVREALGDKPFTKENVKELFQDTEKMNSIRNKALTRGLTVGIVDAFTMKLGGSVGAKMLAKNPANKIGAVAAGTAIESVGGATGEAAAQVLSGEGLNKRDIFLEAVGEMPMGTVSVLSEAIKLPKYHVNGERVSYNTLNNIVETATGDELQKMDIQVSKDQTGIEKKINDKVVTSQIREEVRNSDPNLTDAQVEGITLLEKELRDNQGNTTSVGKEKVQQIKNKINEIKNNKDYAIQEPEAEGGMLRPEQPEVGLQEVGKGDTQGKEAPGAATQEQVIITDEDKARRQSLTDALFIAEELGDDKVMVGDTEMSLQDAKQELADLTLKEEKSKQAPAPAPTAPTAPIAEQVAPAAPVAEKQNLMSQRNTDLFPDAINFAQEDNDSKLSDYAEENGIGVATYTNPENGLVDTIMTGTSDNDFVGFIRIYENGKPTNKFSSKMSNESGNKENFKTMLSEAQKRLPEGHLYTEKTSVSIDGIRVFSNQLNRGYEVATDENGNPITQDVTLNNASVEGLRNARNQNQKEALYNNKFVKTQEEFEQIKAKILELMPQAKVTFNKPIGRVTISLPVLKSTTTQAAPAVTATEQVAPATTEQVAPAPVAELTIAPTSTPSAYAATQGLAEVETMVAEQERTATTKEQKQNVNTRKRIVATAKRAVNTLKSLFPNAEIFIHTDDNAYKKAMETYKGNKDSNGNFARWVDADGKENVRIDINLNTATARTVAHEVAHAVLYKAFRDNPQVYKAFHKKLSAILKADANEALNNFANRYTEADRAEEFIVELAGMLEQNQTSIKPSTFQKIAKLINDVVSKLTNGAVKPFEDAIRTIEDAKDVVTFMSNLADAIREGKAISVEQKQKSEGGAEVVSKASLPELSSVEATTKALDKISSNIFKYTGKLGKTNANQRGITYLTSDRNYAAFYESGVEKPSNKALEKLLDLKPPTKPIKNQISTKEEIDYYKKLGEPLTPFNGIYQTQEEVDNANKKADEIYQKELKDYENKYKELEKSASDYLSPSFLYGKSMNLNIDFSKDTKETIFQKLKDKGISTEFKGGNFLDNYESDLKKYAAKNNIDYYDGIKGGIQGSINTSPDEIILINKDKSVLKSELPKAYHKAKKDGSNPELVSAVENLFIEQKQTDAEFISKASLSNQTPDDIVKRGRANGVSEDAIRKVLENKGIETADIDKALGKVAPAGTKVELSEETLPGYNKLVNRINGIIERGRKKGYSDQKIRDNVVKNVQANDPAYAAATNVQQEQIIRDIDKQLGQKQKSAPSKEKVLGKEKKMVTVDDAAALADQIRLEARAAREAKMDLNKWRDLIGKYIGQMQTIGKITTAQAQAIVRKISKLNVDNLAHVEKFIQYMEKVFADAEYDTKLQLARKNIKKLKDLANNKKKDVNLTTLAKEFLKVDPSLVEDIDRYNAIAASIIESLQGSKITNKKEAEIEFARMVSQVGVSDYVNREVALQQELQRKIADKIAQEQFGVEEGDLTYDQIQELLAEDNTEAVKKYDNIIRAKLKDMFDGLSAVIKSMIEQQEDPFTYERTTFTDSEKKTINNFMSMDINKLSLKEALRAVDALHNFIVNRSTASMDATYANYEAKKAAVDFEKTGKKAKPLKLYFSRWVGQRWTANINNLSVVTERLFKSFDIGGKFEDATGIRKVMNAFSKASRIAYLIEKEYVDTFYKRKANGEDFNTAFNDIERGMVAYMSRTVYGTPAMIKEVFEKRKRIIQQSIQKLENSDSEIKKEKAKLYQKVYDKILADSNNSQEVRDNADSTNVEAVNFWISQWDSKFDKFADVNERVYNTLLEKFAYYTPDRFALIDDSDIKELKEEDLLKSSFIRNNGSSATRKGKSFMKTVEYDNLPKGRYIDLSFDRVNTTAMREALVDSETAAPIRRVLEFLNTKELNSIIPEANDRAILKNRLKKFMISIKGAEYVEQSEIAKFARAMLGFINTGSVMVLNGITQIPKQTIPILIDTALQAKSIDFFNRVHPDKWRFMLNSGHSIANRLQMTEQDIQSIDTLLRKASQSKGEELINALKDVASFYLKWFQAHPDAFAAQSSWLLYYEQSLKKQGVPDMRTINFNGREREEVMSMKNYWEYPMNEEAANYASRMVDRNQNVSQQEAKGELFNQKDPVRSAFVKILLPLASFRFAATSRMQSDIIALTSKTTNSVDKQFHANSLIGALMQIAIFNAISIYIGYQMKVFVSRLMDRDDDDEEKDEMMKKAVINGGARIMTDAISPSPNVDPLIVDGLNIGIRYYQKMKGVDDDEIVSISETPDQKIFGTGSVIYERGKEVYDIWNTVRTGTYTDKYGKEHEITEEDRKFLQNYVLPTSITSTLMLAPSEADRFVKISMAIAKKGKGAERKSEAESKKRIKENLLQGYDTKEDMKRYNPKLYEETFGKLSPNYEAEQEIKQMKKEQLDEERRLKDIEMGYFPKPKKKSGTWRNSRESDRTESKRSSWNRSRD